MNDSIPTATAVIDPANLSALLRVLGFASTTTNGARQYSCPNPDGTQRWMWPSTLRQTLFLKFYSALSLKARLFSALAKLVVACRLQGVFFRQLPGQDASTGEQEQTKAYFDLLTSMPGPVAAQNGAADPTPLLTLSQRNLTQIALPKVLNYGLNYLLQSEVKLPAAYHVRHLSPNHALCLDELLAAASGRQPIKASNCWPHIEEQVAELQHLADSRVPSSLGTKLLLLFRTLDPAQELSFAFAHGDFMPWNCWLGPDKLAIYDLELALPGASLLYDLFHFEAQQALLTTCLPTPDLRVRALAIAAEQFPAVPAAELAVAWKLYLLHQVATGALLYHAQATSHPQMCRLLNGWDALLTLELTAAQAPRQLALHDLLDYAPTRRAAARLQPAA
jgi:hypothetical protein